MASARHVLDVDELDAAAIEQILERATRLRDRDGADSERQLADHHLALLFAEPSTRTRLSFEVAARQSGASTYVLDPPKSSMVKGETFVDTVRNLDAIGMTMLVVRHHRAGSPWVAARWFGGAVINAGDGWHGHPTQALLDLFTLRRALVRAHDPGGRDGVRGRKAVIVGDVLHSRVAKSNVWALSGAGAEVWLCGPAAWLRGLDDLPVRLTSDLSEALTGADAVMGLRVQRERMSGGSLLIDEYVDRYQISEARLAELAAPHAVYLHPGPINEGIEVTREVARGPRSLVMEQVRNGVPVRRAVLEYAAGL